MGGDLAMTEEDLARRDLAKQQRALHYAMQNGQPPDQVAHIQDLVRLRRGILAAVIRCNGGDEE